MRSPSTLASRSFSRGTTLVRPISSPPSDAQSVPPSIAVRTRQPSWIAALLELPERPAGGGSDQNCTLATKEVGGSIFFVTRAVAASGGSKHWSAFLSAEVF